MKGEEKMKKFLSENYWKLGAVFTSSVIFPLTCSANTLGGRTLSIDWPWVAFIRSLFQEVTGDTAKILGGLAIASAIGMSWSGNGNFSSTAIKTAASIGVICWIPSGIQYITSSASGMLAF